MLIETINDHLKKLFGVELSGEPRFRIVWSDSQYEIRYGTYNEFYGSIFLREVKGARQTPKYPYILHRYVLEYLVPVSNPELPNNRLSYEPIYVFEDSKGNPLPLNETVVKLVCQTVLNPTMSSIERKSLFEELDKKNYDQEVAYFSDMLEDSSSYLAGRLADKDGAVVVPRNYKGGD